MIAGETDEGLWPTLRDSLFTVVSLQTTTGFCTADYDQWSFPAKCILVGLMFVGGCAGSTGGGIKVIRFVILAKVLLAEIEAVFRPHVVRTVRVGTSTVESQMRSATLIYFLLFGLSVIISTALVLTFEPADQFEVGASNATVTAFSAVAATLNNIGPGLDLVGPTHNYALFTDATKILLSMLMALGRLELYAFLVLLVPAFWREE
jgi:trk system potassium uptake protein TrkH